MSSNLQTVNRTFLAHSAAALLACVLLVSNALADEPVRAETVKFGDLNVGTSAGVEALYSRIHAAAKRVCSQTDPVVRAAAIPCARQAEAKAIEKLNLPSLTAYYRMKTGNHTETTVAKR
jgi:UrcA family protein